MRRLFTLLSVLVLVTTASAQPDPVDFMHMYRVWPVASTEDFAWEILHVPAEISDLFPGGGLGDFDWWDEDGDDNVSVGDVFYEDRYLEEIYVYTTVVWVGFGGWVYGPEPFAFEAAGYPPPADWTGLILTEVTPDFGDEYEVTGFVPDPYTPQFEAGGQWYEAFYPDMVVQCVVTWDPWVAAEFTSWSQVKSIFE